MSKSASQTRAVDPTRWLMQGLLLAGLMMALLPGVVRAQEKIIKSHGYSYFGDLKYPADFKHFDYVNPDAPKGGEISIAVSGTFNSLNPYTRKGKATGTHDLRKPVG